ncbi:glutamate receptor ionotropic, NMDA 2B-like [Parasteatoda tepidariorum]|uniref:glutamate receptor ionotropic, NMDA 2B-like n=1 Tax=Parasteatoda tepidariorum TaxID=114398 RepID=UPI0039BD1369
MVPQELRVAVIETNDMRLSVDDHGRTALAGVEGKFLQLLMNLMKISFKLIIASDGEWGQELDNGSWTGMIGLIQKGEADMAINKLSITEDRMKVVDFTTPYCDEVVTFGVAAPRRIFYPLIFLYPFDRTIWILCIVVLVILPLIYSLLFHDFSAYNAILFKMIGCLLNQPVINKNKSSMYRFFMSLCLFFSLVISSSYRAVFFSFLTIPFYEQKLRNFHDLSNSVLSGGHKCQTVLGSYIMTLLLTSLDKNLQTIGEIMSKNSWTYHVNIYEERDFHHHVATISTMADLKKINHFYTELAFSDEVLLTTYIGIALKKQFCCKDELNDAINRLVSGGLYEKLESDALMALSVRKSAENLIQREISISLENIYGVFLVLVFGYFLSFLIMIGEILVYYTPLRLEKTNYTPSRP